MAAVFFIGITLFLFIYYNYTGKWRNYQIKIHCLRTINLLIDICVEKGSLRNLLQYFSFVDELEKKLGCHVDVVTTEIDDKKFLEQILKERVLLYERQG